LTIFGILLIFFSTFYNYSTDGTISSFPAWFCIFYGTFYRPAFSFGQLIIFCVILELYKTSYKSTISFVVEQKLWNWFAKISFVAYIIHPIVIGGIYKLFEFEREARYWEVGVVWLLNYILIGIVSQLGCSYVELPLQDLLK
jgi:peptidoglycan/LPS O-acetylase OafA/YrhL